MITPPVALAAYAAASISESDLWDTGVASFKVALPGFLIPYVFVFHNGLLLRGTLVEIVWVTITTTLGIIGLAGALTGYFAGKAGALERVVLVIGALLLIVPEKITDFIGLATLAGVFAWQKTRRSGRSAEA
jgi:TRAP-type uncharacterized transport system fused permease subunit